MTLQEAIESFLFHCRYEKNLSPKTLSAYTTDLGQLAACLDQTLGAVQIEALGREGLRTYIQGLFEKYQARTIKRKIATVHAMLRYLERECTVFSNPFRKMDVRIKQISRLPRTIPFREIERLFTFLYAARATISTLNDPSANLLIRDIAIVEALFATGARVSEICSTRVEDLNLTEGWVRILGKGSRERVIQLCGESTLTALREYEEIRPADTGENYFFRNQRGKRLSEHSVRRALRRCAEAAGVGVAIRPHLIRHSVATLLLEEGVDIRHIQQLLGHSSISVTQIYTHIDSRSQRLVLDAKHPRRRLPGR